MSIFAMDKVAYTFELGHANTFKRDFEIKNDVSSAARRVRVSMVPIKDDHDTALLHNWMNTQHVEEFWKQAWPLNKIRNYLIEKIESYHSLFWVCLNDRPIAYAELYPCNRDPLGQFVSDGVESWGWHLLIGPKYLIGSGISPAIGHVISDYLFSHTLSKNIYCEPDYKNIRMIQFLEKLSYKATGRITLGEKIAELMCCNKSEFYQNSIEPLHIKIPLREYRYAV